MKTATYISLAIAVLFSAFAIFPQPLDWLRYKFGAYSRFPNDIELESVLIIGAVLIISALLSALGGFFCILYRKKSKLDWILLVLSFTPLMFILFSLGHLLN